MHAFNPQARLAGCLAVLATLGGCWWHESEAPAVGPGDRPAVSPILEGTYCGVEADDDGVRLEDDCSRFTWDPDARRILVVEILDEGEEEEAMGQELWLDVAPLSRGLTLIQTSNTESAGAELRYQLHASVARPEGFVILPLPAGEVRNAIAEEEGVSLEPGDADDETRRLTAGSPEALRRVVERSAFAWLQSPSSPNVDRFAPYDPDAAADAAAPRYTVRLEELDPDVSEPEAVEAALAALQAALVSAAES